MKSITINLYSFDELSEDAKEKALQNHQQTHQMHWFDEWCESIKKGLEFFDVFVRDYSITTESNRSYVYFEIHECIKNLTYVRLWKYLKNNYNTFRNQFSGKIQRTFEGNCPFTGFSGDEAFLDPFRKFLKHPDQTTFEDLLKDAIENCLNGIEEDYEYQLSEEFFKEECEANEHQFTANGELY